MEKSSEKELKLSHNKEKENKCGEMGCQLKS